MDTRIEQAIKKYGITRSWRSAGYILPDGRLLDFSEGTGYRCTDHRNVSWLFPDDHCEYLFDYVVKFMNLGVIRVLPEAGGISLTVKPTLQQFRLIKEFVRYSDGEVYIDIINPENGDTVCSAYYDDVKPNRLAGELLRYFDEGIRPIGDELDESFDDEFNRFKQMQLNIILKNNPADPNLGDHTWIRTVDDIKTYREAIVADEEDGYDDHNYTPDYKADIVDKALRTGTITVYSSYPIKQGTFVTPSKMEAGCYAGSSDKVYSKTVDIMDVAWINAMEGQYASVRELSSFNPINESFDFNSVIW